ncbi:MAG: 50S ribosomal protein L11 methyltransferase [Chloroflexota bacterium]|nr:50S ribosomal protein L11 methyltransferase [Chloroflexota bacterium]
MNSNKNNWIKYSVIVSEEFVEPVVQMFSRFLHGSVVVEKEGDPEDGINKESIVSGYVLKTKNSKELEKNLNSGLSLFSGVFNLSNIKITEISSEIWEKQKFDPIIIGDIAILPFREQINKFSDYLWVIIEPSMAFGTGHHPTTKMCISLLEKYLIKNDKVVDLGCGSGILGLVALKIGADNCLSIDVEEESVLASNKNANDSELSNKIKVEKQDLLKDLDIGFSPDLVIANLNSFLFREGLVNISDIVLPNKKIIASGILVENLDEIEAIFNSFNFEIIERCESGDWAAIVAQKNNA